MLGRTQPLEKAIGALEKLVKRHEHPALRSVLGALYVAASEGDGADPAEAVDFLEKALHESPEDAALAGQLAKVLSQAALRTSDGELRKRMVKALETAVALQRDQLSRLLMQLAHAQLKAGRTEDACANAQVAKSLGDSAEAGEFLGDLTADREPAGNGSQRNYAKLTAEVAKVRGFLAAVVMDLNGGVKAVENTLDVDERTLASALGIIYNNARDAALRMEIGDFERCEIDGPFGRAYVAGLGEAVLFAVFDAKARGEAAPGRLEHIIESCVVGEDERGNATG